MSRVTAPGVVSVRETVPAGVSCAQFAMQMACYQHRGELGNNKACSKEHTKRAYRSIGRAESQGQGPDPAAVETRSVPERAGCFQTPGPSPARIQSLLLQQEAVMRPKRSLRANQPWQLPLSYARSINTLHAIRIRLSDLLQLTNE